MIRRFTVLAVRDRSELVEPGSDGAGERAVQRDAVEAEDGVPVGQEEGPPPVVAARVGDVDDRIGPVAQGAVARSAAAVRE